MKNKRRKDPPKPERNKPCPCRSGNKYKKCCFLTEQTAQQDKLKQLKEGMAKRTEQARKNREAHMDNISVYAPQPRFICLLAAAASLGILANNRRYP